MKTIISNSLAIAAIVLLFTLTSCTKDSETLAPDTTTNMEIRLNHSVSVNYDAINLDIEAIYINATTDVNSGWRRVELTNPGVYNLLDQSSIDVLLASKEVATGSLRQVRFVLASRNSVVKNGITTPLSVSTMILNVNAELTAGSTYKLWVDVDAFRSIVEENPIEYKFQPVARTYTENSGIVEGRVNTNSVTTVTAELGNETATTVVKQDGSFRIAGLQASSSWKIVFEHNSKNVAVGNVEINAGQTTQLGTVTLDE